MWLSAAALLAGCASRPAVPVVRQAIHTIAYVPATLPPVIYVQNDSSASMVFGALAQLATSIDNRDKTTAFNAKIAASKPALDRDLNDAVIAGLRARGFEVVDAPELKRPADDPDGIELEAVKTNADAVLHVRFSSVTMVSPRGSIAFVPRMNVRATLLTPKNGEYRYDETTYFGLDSRPNTAWSIVAEPGFSYETPALLIDRSDDIMLRFSGASRALGARIAQLVADESRN